MKVLAGIVNFSHAKDYCKPKLLEMIDACVIPCVDDIIVVGDNPVGHLPYAHLSCNSSYAEDMLITGREWLRRYAIEEDFDKMLWQGMDCFWKSEEDVRTVMEHNVPVVSALTSARDDANKAIARRFVDKEGNQEDISDDELLDGGLIESGFPGADAIFIDRDVFSYPFKEGHTPWYERVNRGQVNLCVEENWCLELTKSGIKQYVDADVRVFHAHEDGIARAWPGEERQMEMLTWQ